MSFNSGEGSVVTMNKLNGESISVVWRHFRRCIMRIPDWLRELQFLDRDFAKGVYTKSEYLQRRLYLQELVAGRIKTNDVYIEPILLQEELNEESK